MIDTKENPRTESGGFQESAPTTRKETDGHILAEALPGDLAEYLAALNVSPSEFVSVLSTKGQTKETAVVAAHRVGEYVASIPATYNAYLAPNPVRGPERQNAGRGTEEQVTRLAAVFADLDVKPGACPSIDVASDLVDAISAHIEERPVVVIFSGGGLQPIWTLEDCTPEVGIPLLCRFGRLVRAIGKARGIKLDSVFDAPRVLRIPGSLNHKYNPPVEAALIPDTGAPMDPATLAERLDEWGIWQEDGDDRIGLGDVVVAERDWKYVAESCGYAAQTIRQWEREPVDGRHPWLLGCLVRLECMRRNGCLTRNDYQAAQRKLEARFLKLLATQEPKRDPKQYEVAELHNVAIDRASRKSWAEIDDELGGDQGHVHLFARRTEAPNNDNRTSPQNDETASQAPAHESAATDPSAGDTAPLADAQTEATDDFEEMVESQLETLRVREEAKRRLYEEQNPTPELPPVMSLRERLAQPRENAKYLVDQLLPRGGRALINAMHKAGKTTLAGNLMRSLVDGEKFLGQFEIHGGPHRVVLVDDEMSENQLLDQLEEHGIKNQDAIADVIPLRGMVSAFNLLDDRTRAQWAERLRALKTDVLIFDCLRPVLDALGLDENRDAGRFLVAFDALLKEAHISEAFVIHHMGHANERARGDSRLQDWPDAIWKMVSAEPDDPTADRFFLAYGRDVSVPEGRLEYDPPTRRLTLAGGSRKQAKKSQKQDETLSRVIEYLAERHRENGEGFEGVPVSHVIATMEDRHRISNRRVYEALKDGGPPGENGRGDGRLANKKGANNSTLWRVEHPCAGCGFPVDDPIMAMHRSCADLVQN